MLFMRFGAGLCFCRVMGCFVVLFSVVHFVFSSEHVPFSVQVDAVLLVTVAQTGDKN